MSSCYWFVNDAQKTWSDAKAACDMTGGHLVVVNDKYVLPINEIPDKLLLTG